MDFEFYNADPPRGLTASLLRPFRRVLRRVQRPYFHCLRDLLQWLFDRQREHAQRQDDFAAHLRAVQEQQKARMEQLERAVAHLNETLAAAQHEKAIFQVDYLAVTRRLARLEDLLIEVLANPPAAACESPGPSLAKIAS